MQAFSKLCKGCAGGCPRGRRGCTRTTLGEGLRAARPEQRTGRPPPAAAPRVLATCAPRAATAARPGTQRGSVSRWALASHTSIREATFTLGVGSKGITWVTEWAPLGSLSEGEHTVWAFGQSLSNGVGARPITLLAVIESGDTCRTTQRTVSTVNLHSEVDSELTQLLLLIQIRQKVH